MQAQTQNKSPDSNSLKNQKLSHVDNFKKYGVVTSSTHNLIINRKNIRILIRTETKMSADEWNSFVNKDAFSRMSNKSLKNSYAALDYKPIQI